MQKNEQVKKPGRLKLPDQKKKVQVIHYIPKMNAAKFKKAVEPLLELYGTVPK